MSRILFKSLGRLFHGGVCILSVAFSLVARSEYLPDAASNLGTMLINHDDLYTTNPLVKLHVRAVNNGTGLAGMQFSDDDQNWSAPEVYSTNKQWQLTVAPQDFPPSMNTVLKTVYVRVRYGDGTWSKAFSDGIVFARSGEDVPITKHVWIMQQRPANYDSSQPLGSQTNPYIVPAGANQVAFDTLMNTLAKTYVQYRAAPSASETNPPPMNNAEVMFLHISAGTYQTHGDNGGRNDAQCWSPVDGGRIKGAGKDATILQVVGGNTNSVANVIGNHRGYGLGFYHNLEICDLTLDANMHEGGDTNSAWLRNGIYLGGNNIQLRRVRVKGFGSRIWGREPAGISGSSAGAGNLYNFFVEDCEVIAPQAFNKYNPLMIGIWGGGQDAQGKPYYLINVVLRNNYVNGLMYNGSSAINPYTSSFFERGSHGIGLGGGKNAVIEDNLAEHVVSGYYNEVYDLNDLVIRNNHFRDVVAGFNAYTGVADVLRFEGNLIELDPHYYTAPAAPGGGPSDYGWRKGISLNETRRIPITRVLIVSNTIQFTAKATPQPPLRGVFANAALSGTAIFDRNKTFGLKDTTVKWYQDQGFPITYYDQQADILDTSKSSPITMSHNYREDGTIIEVYPYVLDKTLPRPVIVPNQTITFTAPLIDGVVPKTVGGLPETNLIGSDGIFTWRPGPTNIGRYMVSFYSSPNRTNDARRTIITVQSGLTNQNPFYFKSGLRGYWKFGESAGNLFRDSSGNSNHIVISTSSQNYLDLGAAGHRLDQKAAHFKNTNPIRIYSLTIPNENPQLLNGLPLSYQPFLDRTTALNQPFTISYWFKCDHKPASYEIIFNYASLVMCGVASSADTNSNIAEIFCNYGYSPDLQYYQATHPEHIKVTVGDWHHFVFVYDGLGTRIYIDGGKQSEIPCGQIEDFDAKSVNTLGGGWGSDNYSGSLSELAIWNRPLSDSEVADVYSSQQRSSAFPSIGLLASPSNLRINP
jgi:hypothetical protein